MKWTGISICVEKMRRKATLCICSFYFNFNLHRRVSERAIFSVQQDHNVGYLIHPHPLIDPY